MELPIVKDTDDMGDFGMGLVAEAIRATGHIFRPNEKRDFGIDGQIEVVIQDGSKRHATGCLIAVQVKCGPSYLKDGPENSYVYYCSKAHANYWQGHSLPVIVVICDPSLKICHWALVDNTSLSLTPEGAKIVIPKSRDLSISGKNLAEIAEIGRLKQLPAAASRFILPLSEKYDINLSDDELGVLCSEIALAFDRKESVALDVDFAIESHIAREADALRSIENRTVDQRKRLIELETMSDWIAEKKEALVKGVRIILAYNFFRLSYLDVMDCSALSRAMRGFVHYYIFKRMGQQRPTALILDAFPDNGSGKIVARVYLDENQKDEFLKRDGLNGNIDLLKWPGYIMGDLGRDIIIDSGIPAVATEILFYLKRNNINEEKFFSDQNEMLMTWRIGLA